MPASVEVLVWLERREYDALKQALQASGIDSVEREAERLLRQRYEQLVPKEQREQIEEQLQKDTEQEAREREAARRYSAVRITEGGLSHCFEADNMDMVSHAFALSRYLQGEYSASTLAQEYTLSHNIKIDDAVFCQYREALGKSPNVTGAFEINLDAGTFTTWDRATGQPTSYSIKSISTAIHYAVRSKSLPFLFEERLKGKELPADPEQEDGPKLEM